MKILFTRFPLESRYGGAEVQILTLMKGLKERGHDVRFLGNCKELLAMSDQQSLTSLEIGPPPVTKWLAVSFLWRQFSMKRKIIRAIQELTADSSQLTAIFMVSLSEKLLLTRWAHTQGLRVIWIEHDSVGRWLAWNPWLPVLRRLSRLATTVCVSELSRTFYLRMKWRPQDVTAIPNGVDVSRFGNFSPRPEDGTPLHVGCVARLHKEKGVDVLIEAVKMIPAITLDIVGQGPEEASLRALMEPDRMTLMRDFAHIANFYSQIDVLVLPSRSNDPFGLVAAEAMRLGIPVIVTECCGIAGYLRAGEDALIVKGNSKEALAEAIKSVWEPQIWKALSVQGRRTANRLFDVGRMVDAYELLAHSAGGATMK